MKKKDGGAERGEIGECGGDWVGGGVQAASRNRDGAKKGEIEISEGGKSA